MIIICCYYYYTLLTIKKLRLGRSLGFVCRGIAFGVYVQHLDQIDLMSLQLLDDSASGLIKRLYQLCLCHL